MFYHTKELCDLLGIGSKALRLYEQLHLLNPQREEGNGYHLFTQRDLFRILEIKKYQEECDSLQSVYQLISSRTSEEMLANLQFQVDRVQSQIESLQKKRDFLQRALVSRRRNHDRLGNVFQIDFPPGDVYVLLDSDRPLPNQARAAQLYRQWAQCYSQLNLLVVADLTHKNADGSFGYSVGVVNKSKQSQPLLQQGICQPMPSGTAICRPIPLRDISQIHPEDIQPLLDHFLQHRLSLPQQIFFHHDMTLTQEGNELFCFLAIAYVQEHPSSSL